MKPSENNTSILLNADIRVLVVDNEISIRSGIVEDLLSWGYQAFEAEGEQEDLIVDALRKASTHRCHIAIVDMHLLDDYDRNDWSGLQLARDLLPATKSIIFTGSQNYKAAEKAIKTGAERFINKGEGPAPLHDAVDEIANKISALHRELKISWPLGIKPSSICDIFPDGDQYPIDEPADLLAILFPNASRLHLDVLRDANGKNGSATRPRSYVFKVWEDERQPVIVKIAKVNRIREETEKYHQYVDGKLVGNYYPELQNSQILWDLGGIVYRFIGQEEDIFTMADYYDGGSIVDITKCLDQFFQVIWSNHYRTKQAIQGESLFEIYSRIWRGKGWLEIIKEKAYEGIVADVLSTWPSWKSLGGYDPVQWLMDRVDQDRAGNFQETLIAITHGDLHADNIIMDARNHNAWPIDFERTGSGGHVLQDFTELETDVIHRLSKIQEDEFSLFYELCVFVTRPGDVVFSKKMVSNDIRLNKSYAVITNIRQNAVRMTDIHDGRQYLWGLLLNSMFRTALLFKIGDYGYRAQRSLMLASMICYRLDHWGAEWPPQSWPQLVNRKQASQNKGISRSILFALRKHLELFSEFNSDQNLRAIFITDELKPFRSRLPSSTNISDRVNQTIDYLADKRLSDERSALICFLQTLAENYPPPDKLGLDLIELIRKLPV